MGTLISIKPIKNHINRDYYEMTRIINLMKRGYINKEDAIDMFQEYIKNTRGRYAVRKFPYKKAA